MPPTPEQWARLKEIVASALEMPTAQRAAFIEEACGGDQSLLEEARSLLEFQPTAVLSDAPAEPLARGDLLCGRYLVDRTLGHGGFATAWLAHDQQLLNRRVVIKLLGSAGADPYIRRKFADELSALSALEHPNIIAPLDSGLTASGAPFIVTQFADGKTLGQILEEGTPPLDRTVRIISQIGHTLSFIHAAGIIHRDLKPENIIVQTFADGTEHVRLIDFGIASVDVSGRDRSTRIVGSLAYMAPEQLLGTVSTAVDVYALGVTAYEMLTGDLPFTGNTPAQQVQQHAKGISKRPADLRPDLPPAAEALLMKALQRDPARRPADAAQFATQLCSALQSGPATRRSPVPWLIGAAAVLALTLAVTLLVLRSHRTASPANAATAAGNIAPPAAVLPVSLALAVERRRPSGLVPPAGEGRLTLRPGDEFRLELSSAAAGHFYLFSESAQMPGLHILFPSPTSNGGSSQLQSTGTLHIPQTSWFRTDSRPASNGAHDLLDVIWSKAEVPEFEAAVRFANANDRGAIPAGAELNAIRLLLGNPQPLHARDGGWSLAGDPSAGLLTGRLEILSGETSAPGVAASALKSLSRREVTPR